MFAQDEPVIIQRKIDLKYKVFGKKRSEDTTMKAGSLTVSAVFQPVESVAKSGEEMRASTSGRVGCTERSCDEQFDYHKIKLVKPDS